MNIRAIRFVGLGSVGIQQQVNSFVFGLESNFGILNLKQADQSISSPTRFRYFGIDKIASVSGKFGACLISFWFMPQAAGQMLLSARLE